MYFMRLDRICPDLAAELIFDPLGWKSSYGLLGKKIGKEVPTLNAVLRNLATLVGFLGWKFGDKKFQRIQDCVDGIQMARKLKILIQKLCKKIACRRSKNYFKTNNKWSMKSMRIITIAFILLRILGEKYVGQVR